MAQTYTANTNYTYTVRIDGGRHTVTPHTDHVWAGAQCEQCGNGTFTFNRFALNRVTQWELVCEECNENYPISYIERR